MVAWPSFWLKLLSRPSMLYVKNYRENEPIDRQLEGSKNTPRYEPPPEKWASFSVGVAKYRNKLSVFVVTAPSVNIFKKRLEKVWTEVFPHLPHWLKSHHPYSLKKCTPFINRPHLYMLPKTLFCVCGFFRPADFLGHAFHYRLVFATVLIYAAYFFPTVQLLGLLDDPRNNYRFFVHKLIWNAADWGSSAVIVIGNMGNFFSTHALNLEIWLCYDF